MTKDFNCSRCSNCQNSANGRLPFTTIVDDLIIQPDARGVIKWHLVNLNLTDDQPKYKTILAFEQCFSLWGAVMHPLRFESTKNFDEADIKIQFAHSQEDYPDLPEDFEKNVLAYAYAPVGRHRGKVFFNDQYKWQERHSANGVNLQKVATHEIGHCLNIGHTDASEIDIMYWLYQPNDEINFTQDTIDAVNHLYGAEKRKHTKNTKRSPKEIAYDALFSTPNDLRGLREAQIVRAGKAIEADVDTKYWKKVNAERLFEATR